MPRPRCYRKSCGEARCLPRVCSLGHASEAVRVSQSHRIVRGAMRRQRSVPMSSQSFSQLGVSQPVVAALADRGITEPFAIQRLVVADVLAGRDVLAKSPTGSGKTLAFGVPMLDRLDPRGPQPAGLVLAPTRELATQIVDELRAVADARRLAIAPVYGGVGYEKQIRNARRAHVIVATPGRLEDLLERRALSLDRIRLLVLDEA